MTIKTKEFAFGSKEWLSELERRTKFPRMFAIHYGKHKKEDEDTLTAVILDTKSTNPDNLKLGKTTEQSLTMALSPYNWLFVGAYYIRSANEYLETMSGIAKRFDVKFGD